MRMFANHFLFACEGLIFCIIETYISQKIFRGRTRSTSQTFTFLCYFYIACVYNCEIHILLNLTLHVAYKLLNPASDLYIGCCLYLAELSLSCFYIVCISDHKIFLFLFVNIIRLGPLGNAILLFYIAYRSHLG